MVQPSGTTVILTDTQENDAIGEEKPKPSRLALGSRQPQKTKKEKTQNIKKKKHDNQGMDDEGRPVARTFEGVWGCGGDLFVDCGPWSNASMKNWTFLDLFRLTRRQEDSRYLILRHCTSIRH